MILKVIERGLKRIGFTVTSTTSPIEALEYLRRDSEQFTLLISDVKMPELNGPEMIQVALAEGIVLPTYLYITGYIDDQAAASFKVSKERVLFKPFTPETLRARIFQLLDLDP
jgi:CheY-like chemotaxis protein